MLPLENSWAWKRQNQEHRSFRFLSSPPVFSSRRRLTAPDSQRAALLADAGKEISRYKEQKMESADLLCWENKWRSSVNSLIKTRCLQCVVLDWTFRFHCDLSQVSLWSTIFRLNQWKVVRMSRELMERSNVLQQICRLIHACAAPKTARHMLNVVPNLQGFKGKCTQINETTLIFPVVYSMTSEWIF